MQGPGASRFPLRTCAKVLKRKCGERRSGLLWPVSSCPLGVMRAWVMVEAQWLCRCAVTSVGDVYRTRCSIISLCPPNSYEKGATKGLIS